MPTIEQGIVEPTGMETFTKEPKLAKVLPELKPTPVSLYQESCWFFSHDCKDKFAVFWALCYETTCKWVLFLYAL